MLLPTVVVIGLLVGGLFYNVRALLLSRALFTPIQRPHPYPNRAASGPGLMPVCCVFARALLCPQTPQTLSGSRTYFGALFLSVMFTAMGSMPQLAITMTYKP